MQRFSIALSALVAACLIGSSVATDYSPCPTNANQLCKDCVTQVASVAPDGYGNTLDSLKKTCPYCTSDLCRQCLTYPVGAFGLNYKLEDYPACTQKYLKKVPAALSLFNNIVGPIPKVTGTDSDNAPIPGVSTKALCASFQTSDTLKCFDYGYGSLASGQTLYGYFEALCVAAQSDLQRRCLWQYTAKTSFEGLPTNTNSILKHVLPLCLSLSSEAQYSCLKSQVQSLAAATATTTKDVGVYCGLFSSSWITC